MNGSTSGRPGETEQRKQATNNNMNEQKVMIGAVLACLAMLNAACRNDKEEDLPAPAPVNEEELITTVELHFHSAGGSEHKHISFTDPDGSGGGTPVITGDTLSSDSLYEVEVELWNDSGSPAVDISEEVTEEAEEHQFFFQVSGANAAIVYADTDANGHPIGLLTNWTVGAASTGTVTVTLRHQPDKSAVGVSAGDITNAGGETDVEVTLPLVIE